MSFQLVITLGPASDRLLEPLIEAGASAFRLNTAHMSLEKITVLTKIERSEAISHLGQISEQFDSLWVCRGDLGAQIGLPRMAAWVSSLVPRSLSRPVWMAGQVLEHLTAHPEPTRSEVCHLCDLISRGYAGIVLSDETAIGENPVQAVKVAASLVRDFL
jgi:pyruvate kinase